MRRKHGDWLVGGKAVAAAGFAPGQAGEEIGDVRVKANVMRLEPALAALAGIGASETECRVDAQHHRQIGPYITAGEAMQGA